MCWCQPLLNVIYVNIGFCPSLRDAKGRSIPKETLPTSLIKHEAHFVRSRAKAWPGTVAQAEPREQRNFNCWLSDNKSTWCNLACHYTTIYWIIVNWKRNANAWDGCKLMISCFDKFAKKFTNKDVNIFRYEYRSIYPSVILWIWVKPRPQKNEDNFKATGC